MSAIALTATSRCRVGPGVLQLPLRSSAAVAKAAATLDVVSGGRFLLGVGSGEHRVEYERCGASFDTRGADLDRGIDAMRAAWVPTDDRFAQRPVPGSIPIWVGGRSRSALRRAAARGDGWMPIFIGVDQYRDADRELDDLVRDAGRDPADVERAVAVIVAVTDRRSGRREALEWAGRLWDLDPSRLERHVVAGPAEACAEQLHHYRAAGADHISVLLATDEPVAMFGPLASAFSAGTPLSSQPEGG